MPRYSVYLLYWYKSTCFTGTKVLDTELPGHPPHQEGEADDHEAIFLHHEPQHACARISDVHLLSPPDVLQLAETRADRCSLYCLLYWYKSTNTDAEGRQPRRRCVCRQRVEGRGREDGGAHFTTCSLYYLLLVYEY